VIPQYQPHFDYEEAQAVADYLSTSPWLTEYKQTTKLEESISHWTNAAHCLMVPNATLALMAAYYVLGVRPGDEVICPVLTQQATANAALLLGASIRFVDVDPDTLCLNVRHTMDIVSDRTKIISLVHFNGRCPPEADLAALGSLNIPVVEDAAQGLGSHSSRGRHLGAIFDIGVISFSTPKIISTGQGGCLLTSDPNLANCLGSFKDFGRCPDDHDLPGFGSFHTPLDFGINLKFTDLQAVVGLVQMRKLSTRVGRKKWIYQYYRDRLQPLMEVSFLPTSLGDVTPWMVDIYVDDRDGLVADLAEKGIGTRPFYPPLHFTGPYADTWGAHAMFPMAERYSKRGLWLPCGPEIKDYEVEQVCGAIRKYYGK
jgi:perosamine synthetase